MSGLTTKYRVEKLNDPEGKHRDCRYFVLDPHHDLAAREAILEYARCTRQRDLAAELVEWVVDIETAERGGE